MAAGKYVVISQECDMKIMLAVTSRMKKTCIDKTNNDDNKNSDCKIK